MTAYTPQHYREPGWFTRQILNRAVAGLTGLGISVLGSRVLAVRGRTTGKWRTTPVNLLSTGGKRYLVAPRGEAQWVRNLRASEEGELRLGRRAERFTATDVADDVKPAILRAYLKKWKMEAGVFFGGAGPDTPDPELRRIAPRHPVFEITTAA